MQVEPVEIVVKRSVGVHHAPEEIALWNLLQACDSGRVPRISRLMMCAVLLDHKLRSGVFENQTAIAARYRLTKMAVTRLLQLLLLAPDIAEEIMFLPAVEEGADPIKPRQVRPITQEWDWRKQRAMWAALKQAKGVVVNR